MSGLGWVEDPQPAFAAASESEFLARLSGPTFICQRGGSGIRRAITTLLHGNERSGLRALRRWLASAARPAGDTLFLVANIAAGQANLRHLPSEPDWNRCFTAAGEHHAHPEVGPIAAAILDRLATFAPACLWDVHNTTGSGPPFGVCTRDSLTHAAMIAPFAERMIVTDLRLGAMMEAAEDICPAVTVECGGTGDARADEVAFAGIRAVLTAQDPTRAAAEVHEILHHPVRVELAQGLSLGYADGPGDFDVTLRSDVESLNFHRVETDECIGWLGPSGLDALRAETADGHDILAELLRAAPDGSLVPRQPLHLFMITGDAAAAREDCLFYTVPAAPHSS